METEDQYTLFREPKPESDGSRIVLGDIVRYVEEHGEVFPNEKDGQYKKCIIKTNVSGIPTNNPKEYKLSYAIFVPINKVGTNYPYLFEIHIFDSSSYPRTSRRYSVAEYGYVYEKHNSQSEFSSVSSSDKDAQKYLAKFTDIMTALITQEKQPTTATTNSI